MGFLGLLYPVDDEKCWILRKILNLRILAKPYLVYHLGRGNAFNLWYDQWLPTGPINPNVHMVLHYGLSKDDKVDTSTINNAWVLS